MEKPDANGYVNITWPSKTIPHGGIFHTKIVEPSATQQEFLKLLLDESKLTLAQRRKNAFALRQEAKTERKLREQIPLVRPRTSRRRSLSAIRESEILNVDDFRPLKKGENREKLKERLANSMAYGDVEQKPPQPPRLLKQEPKLPTKKEQWNDLVTQIRERAEWLAEMEDLGHAGPHRELIHDQIVERMRALDALGVESQCSSARSKGSGFSMRYNESARTNASAKTMSTNVSNVSHKKKSTRPIHKPRCTEENVAAYEKLTPLEYSPRRRV